MTNDGWSQAVEGGVINFDGRIIFSIQNRVCAHDRLAGDARQSEKQAMKTCGYCGRENVDETESCSECGTPFLTPAESPILEDNATMLDDVVEFFRLFFRLPVSPWIKWLLWTIAWGFVVCATFSTDPQYLAAALSFPVGFYGLLPERISIIYAWLGAWLAIIGGWALYAALTLAIQTAKRIVSFSFWYLFFCVLLILNVVGCRNLIHTASGIH